jgi:cytochrome b subunit of formate dehydrogenase
MEWNLSLILLLAMVSGALLSVGNLSMQWATSVFGAPLTTVLAMQASLTVVIGTSISYVLEPQ